jgi:UDP-N-acetylmuramate-alanine ligase
MNTMDALLPLGRALFTFVLNEKARVRAVNIVHDGIGSSFDVLLDGSFHGHINLRVAGQQNVVDALAAIAASG